MFSRCNYKQFAYAVWAGIGAVGTVVLGILVFKEPVT
ncbi:MAG TPA: hypothetical protein GX708_08205, partial [Gallicola sp.]|nr:hypothetical protein [Gallicola sp.]